LSFVKGLSGWLSPEGVFYPCQRGEHSHFAEKYYNTQDESEGHYIPMGVSEPDGEYSFLVITKRLTSEQSLWFETNWELLNPIQKDIVENYRHEQEESF